MENIIAGRKAAGKFFTSTGRATAFEILAKSGIMGNMEFERLKEGLERVKDPRRTNGGHILHKLEDIIIIGLCTVICGGEDFPERTNYTGAWM